MTTFKRLMTNTFLTTKFWVLNWMTSVISTLLLGGPSLIAKVQYVLVFWSHGIIKNSHYSDFILQFYYSPMTTEWAEKGQLDTSLYQMAGSLHRSWSKCSTTTLALILLDNLRVNYIHSITSMGKEDEMFVKLLKYTGDHQAGLSIFRSLRMSVQIFFLIQYLIRMYHISSCMSCNPQPQ